MSYLERQKSLSAAMQAGVAKAQIDALLITNLPDVRWLTGFTGSNAAVILRAVRGVVRGRLFTDGRYTAQAAEEVQGIPFSIAKKSAAAAAIAWLEKTGGTSVHFDSGSTTVDALEAMKKAVSSKLRRSFFHPVKGLVANLREVKDAGEVEAMRAAAALGCEVYEALLGWMDAGMREVDIAAELEYRARLGGAEAMSFETIVASGPRGALPHGKASEKRLAAGEMVTLDFGVILGGYCSDMTRTVYLGKAGAKGGDRKGLATHQRQVFEAVLAAQEAAVAAVKAGVTAGEVDEAARAVLRAAGLEKQFSHSTGHGVGLEIHEGPRVGAKATETLKAGMVITIEPGAYLEGKFGVRIEDIVVVTDWGCEVLTTSPKVWTEL